MDNSYLLLHTSLIDNSPNSVCEAQVAGLPVICTNVGGTSSLIQHGLTGMLSSLDPYDIAEKAQALLCNPELHATLKRESSTMARHRHDPQTIADRTMAIYRKVIAEY
jgi:glycosyltransferase involved in cell wall biosynthesis